MDPQATWELLLDGICDHDWESVGEHATALLNWMEKGGLPPQTVPHRELTPPVNRLLVMGTCRMALEHAQKETSHDTSAL